MEDLREYSDDELSLRVFNDEYLYDIRHTGDLEFIIDEYFVYTLRQYKVLQADLREDKQHA